MKILATGLTYKEAVAKFGEHADKAIIISDGTLFICMTLAGYRVVSLADPNRHIVGLPEEDQVCALPWIAVEAQMNGDEELVNELREYFKTVKEVSMPSARLATNDQVPDINELAVQPRYVHIDRLPVLAVIK
jgi:hypothetical protein